MDRSEWLKWRKIGSSDAPPIMGVSPWTTRYELWLQKIMGTERDDSYAMKRGRALEEEARRMLEERTGLMLAPTNIESRSHSFMTASLDGYDTSQKKVAEIKTANREDHASVKQGKIPDHYFPQLQHQIECAEVESVIYFSYYKDEKLNIIDGVQLEVYRDDSYIKKLIQEEEIFWDMILNQKEPEKTEKDEPYLSPNMELQGIFNEYAQESAILKEKEMKVERLKKELIERGEGKNYRFDGGILYKSLTKGNVQYKNIPELKGINLDLYRSDPYLKWCLRIN